MMARALVAIVSGGLKVFVNDAAQTKLVIEALREAPKAQGTVLGGYAAAAAKVMQAATQAYPEHRMRGLRDVAWHGRPKLPAPLAPNS